MSPPCVPFHYQLSPLGALPMRKKKLISADSGEIQHIELIVKYRGNASSFLSVESETSQAIVARSVDDMVKDLNARLALTMTPEEIDEYKRNLAIQRSIQRAIYQQGYRAFRDGQIVPLGQNLPAPPPRRAAIPIVEPSTNMK